MQQRYFSWFDRQCQLAWPALHRLSARLGALAMRPIRLRVAPETPRFLLLTISLVFCGSASAEYRAVALESLVPTDEHRQATAVVLQLMQRYHYSRVPVDDTLSEQIFDRYIESLDPQKSFFLASDIEEFAQYREKFDDALRAARLAPVFDIFKRFRARVEGRAEYARSLLTSEFDFTIDESYIFNREDEAWPQSQEEADELWRKRVKNDVLSLRLAERSEDEWVETLGERYERMERRISQLAANEVFQIFTNAYTLSVEPHTSYFHHELLRISIST